MSLVYYKCVSLVFLGMDNAKKIEISIPLLPSPWVSVQ